MSATSSTVKKSPSEPGNLHRLSWQFRHSSKKLSSLTGLQIPQLDARDLARIPRGKISQLSPRSLSSLTTEQLKEIPMRKILCLNDEQLLCLIPKLPRDRILEISLKLPFPMLHLLHKQLSDQQIKEVYLCHYNAQAGTIDFEDTPDSFTELRLASAGLYLGQRNFRLALLTAYDILWHKGGKEKILALLEDWREMGTTSRELANIIQQLKSGSQMWTVFLTLPESCRVAIQPFLREDNVELMVKAQDHLIRSRYHYIPKEASTERPWEERLICGVITAKLLSQSKDYKPE